MRDRSASGDLVRIAGGVAAMSLVAALLVLVLVGRSRPRTGMAAVVTPVAAPATALAQLAGGAPAVPSVPSTAAPSPSPTPRPASPSTPTQPAPSATAAALPPSATPHPLAGIALIEAITPSKADGGVAVSLKRLASQVAANPASGADALPVKLVGVWIDHAENDVVLLTQPSTDSHGLSPDAIAVASRALRHRHHPGVDIEPVYDASNRMSDAQNVHYFGGIEGTVVGLWLQVFDYRMKKIAIGDEPAGFPSYAALTKEAMIAGRLTGSAGNRWWLCLPDDVEIVERGDMMHIASLSLAVRTEVVAPEMTEAGARSCSSRLANPLADQFAQSMSENLDRLPADMRVQEIRTFTALLAVFTWLDQVDPRFTARNLQHWMVGHSPRQVRTPDTVPTLRARLEHRRANVVQTLEVAGGVLLEMRLRRLPSAGDAATGLEDAVRRSRPGPDVATWPYSRGRPYPDVGTWRYGI
jgi:hypothetical protein